MDNSPLRQAFLISKFEPAKGRVASSERATRKSYGIFKSPSESLAVILVCCLATLFYLSVLNYSLFRCDNICFLLGAWGMASKQGYVDVSRPGLLPLLKYPPAYSLTIAPFVGYVGPHLKWLRIAAIIPFVAGLPLLYKLLRPRVEQRSALFILLIYACHPMAVWHIELLCPFGIQVLVGFGTLLLAERMQQTKECQVKPHQTEMLLSVALGVLLAAGFYVHKSMLCLIIVALLYFLFRRQNQSAIIALLVATCLMAPWMLRSYYYSGHWLSPEYEAEIAGRIQDSAPHQPGWIALIQHIRINAAHLPTEVGLNLIPWSQTNFAQRLMQRFNVQWLPIPVAWLMCLLILLGYVNECRRRATLADWYVVGQIFLLLIYFVSFKYFYLLIPWLFLYLGRGIEVVTPKLKPISWEWVGWAGAVLLLVLATDKFYWDQRGWPVTDDRDPRWAWVAAKVPPTETIYWLGLDNYAWAPWRYFDSGRMAVGVTATDLNKQLGQSSSSMHYLVLPKSSSFAPRLIGLRWRLIAQAPPKPQADSNDQQMLWSHDTAVQKSSAPHAMPVS